MASVQPDQVTTFPGASSLEGGLSVGKSSQANNFKESPSCASLPKRVPSPSLTATHGMSQKTNIEELAKVTDPNVADELGRTALHHYAAQGNVEATAALIDNGARLDQKDKEGKTPLDLASEAGAPEELLTLLDFAELYVGLGGEPQVLPTSLLSEKSDVISFLKHYVHDKLMAQDKKVSYFSIRVAIGDKVGETGASYQLLGQPKTLWVTLGCNFRKDLELTKDFLKVAGKKGIKADRELQGHLENYQDVDASDPKGETAVYKAARNDDTAKLELLDLACADLDLQDCGGATALFISSQGGCFFAVKFLLDHRAQVDLPLTTKATPLYVACQNGHHQVVDLLLAFAADPNSQTDDLATPLFIAAQMGHFSIVKQLVEKQEDTFKERLQEQLKEKFEEKELEEKVQQMLKGAIDRANRTKATPLFIAAQNNHAGIVKYLLDKKANINACTAGGASPTYIAAQKGCMQALALLLKEPGANRNLSANDGATPILIAAQNGHIEVVRFLIKKGVDVKKAMKSGATPLFVAAQNGILEVADCLVAHDKSLVNMSLHNGTSPFYVAAQNGHLKVVTFLYEKNADIWKQSCGGASPFFIAAQNGHLEILKFLLEVEGKNSRPDTKEPQIVQTTEDGSAPLLVSSQNGHLEVVKLLTTALQGAFQELKVQELINQQKNGGATALYLASQNGHHKVVSHLLDVAASVERGLDTKETPLFIASQGGHTEVVVHLLEANGDVNQGKHDNSTPLYIASQNHHTDVVQLLLEARADTNAQNDGGATALFISCQKGFDDIVKELLRNDIPDRPPADWSKAISSGACPLYIGAMKGHHAVCRMLLQCRADANQTPEHQTTPLLIAIRQGHLEVAGLFLEAEEVDVNKANDKGDTPLQQAVNAGFSHLVEKLIARGAQVDVGSDVPIRGSARSSETSP